MFPFKDRHHNNKFMIYVLASFRAMTEPTGCKVSVLHEASSSSQGSDKESRSARSKDQEVPTQTDYQSWRSCIRLTVQITGYKKVAADNEGSKSVRISTAQV